jgi:hypothetical protein
MIKVKCTVLAFFFIHLSMHTQSVLSEEFCHDSASAYLCIPYPSKSYCQAITDKEIDAARRYTLKKGQKKSKKRGKKIAKKFTSSLNRGKEDAMKKAACNEMEEKGLWKWIPSSWVQPPVLTTEQFHAISALKKKQGVPMGPYVISDKK